MILGDFNYPDIDYEQEYVSAGEDAASTRFFNKTQELCLIQCVTQPTAINLGLHLCWWRQPDRRYWIQWTTGEKWPCHLAVEPPVTGKWAIWLSGQKNYWKGDYDKITTELSEISWNEELRDKSAEGMWLTFKQIVGELSDLHIPAKKISRKRKVIGCRRTHAKRWRNAVKHGINTVVFDPVQIMRLTNQYGTRSLP